MSEVSENLQQPQRARRKPFDLSAALSRRVGILLGLGTVLSFATIPVCLAVVKPKYSASAVLLVDATKEIAINGKERDLIPGDIGDYTRTETKNFKATKESEMVERWEFIDDRFANPNHLVMELPRGGNSTRKNQTDLNNSMVRLSEDKEFNFQY